MHDRAPPGGGGVTYARLYDWLNCLGISPCLVWLNTNATVRDAGSARAAELNAEYASILAGGGYKNFDMAYYDMPLEEVFERWEKMGGARHDLIEPV
jgi:acyloxyacyl hydrolase